MDSFYFYNYLSDCGEMSMNFFMIIVNLIEKSNYITELSMSNLQLGKL